MPREDIVRMLNRVNAWNRDGITIEADQRHVREILKGLELERANHSAAPCVMERKGECKGEHQRGQGQIQTEYKWDGVNNGEPQRSGQGKACRHAESVDTGGFQSRAIRHEEGRYEREPS